MQRKAPTFYLFLFVLKGEKTLAKLMVDVQETQEILNKHKTDNNVRHQMRLTKTDCF